jgi:hypothetical protein
MAPLMVMANYNTQSILCVEYFVFNNIPTGLFTLLFETFKIVGLTKNSVIQK